LSPPFINVFRLTFPDFVISKNIYYNLLTLVNTSGPPLKPPPSEPSGLAGDEAKFGFELKLLSILYIENRPYI
jgi:hypothetical protein